MLSARRLWQAMLIALKHMQTSSKWFELINQHKMQSVHVLL